MFAKFQCIAPPVTWAEINHAGDPRFGMLLVVRSVKFWDLEESRRLAKLRVVFSGNYVTDSFGKTRVKRVFEVRKSKR